MFFLLLRVLFALKKEREKEKTFYTIYVTQKVHLNHTVKGYNRVASVCGKYLFHHYSIQTTFKRKKERDITTYTLLTYDVSHVIKPSTLLTAGYTGSITLDPRAEPQTTPYYPPGMK